MISDQIGLVWLRLSLRAEVDWAATTRESRVDRKESREHDVIVGKVGTLSSSGNTTGESGGGVLRD